MGWEYFVDLVSTEKRTDLPIDIHLMVELGKRGQDCWELVAFCPANPAVSPCLFYAVFKRPAINRVVGS